MKKLMILGAGVYQVPLIRKAKQLGCETLVASIPGAYPGFRYADRAFYVDTTDEEAILQIAREEAIDGICTTGTDVAVKTIGRVCEAMELRGLSARAAEIAVNKDAMKQAFLEHGVRTAEVREVPLSADDRAVQAVCEELGYPVIVKAIDSSGSRGITVVRGPEEISAAVRSAREITRQDRYLIEEYLEGEEFGAQAFVQDGRLEFVLPHGDEVYQGDAGVPVGHYVPFDHPEFTEDAVRQTERAVEAMGLDNCALNIDFIVSRGQVYMIEIGARGGATCLVELVSLYYGYDYYEKIIRVALGETVDFSPANARRVPNAGRLLVSDRSGRIQAIQNANKASDWLVDVSFDYAVGDDVRRFRVGPDRLGQVIVTGATPEEAKRHLSEAVRNVRIEVE